MYKLLTFAPPDSLSMSINKLGMECNIRYCNSCRMYRPLRCAHSRRLEACIMRFDHYCPWIGTDVGMGNHYCFYRMVVWITIYTVVVGVVSAVIFSFSMA